MLTSGACSEKGQAASRSGSGLGRAAEGGIEVGGGGGVRGDVEVGGGGGVEGVWRARGGRRATAAARAEELDLVKWASKRARGRAGDGEFVGDGGRGRFEKDHQQ